MKYLYSTESKTAFQFSERLAAREDMVVLDAQELAAVQQHGRILESVLAERDNSVVIETPPPAPEPAPKPEPLPAPEPVQMEKTEDCPLPNPEDWKIDPKDNGRAKAEKMRAGLHGEDVKTQMRVYKGSIEKENLKRAIEGEADVWGDKPHDAMMDLGSWNATQERLDATKDEDLIRFARQAFEVEFDEPPSDFDDAQLKTYYDWVRDSISKKIKKANKKRALRNARPVED